MFAGRWAAPIACLAAADANADLAINVQDPVYILNYDAALGPPPPFPVCGIDPLNDGVIGNPDAIAILNFVFPPHAPIPAPSPHVCGIDPTGDAIGCETYLCLVPNDFRRGDCNVDSLFDIADGIYTLGVVLPPPGPFPTCKDACDSNNDGMLDIADPIYFLTFLFSMGPLPPAPFPDCGCDPTPFDTLGCEEYLMVGCP